MAVLVNEYKLEFQLEKVAKFWQCLFAGPPLLWVEPMNGLYSIFNYTLYSEILHGFYSFHIYCDIKLKIIEILNFVLYNSVI